MYGCSKQKKIFSHINPWRKVCVGKARATFSWLLFLYLRECELLREELGELRDRHVATDAELSVAREEKKMFDAALQTIKDDMARVRYDVIL